MIGGTLYGRNCFDLDYCLEASLDSLLGVCDEVVVLECESSDNTFEFLRARADADPRINLHRVPWLTSREGVWLRELGNAARAMLKSDYHVHLQADEVIHEDSYPLIRQIAKTGHAAFCHRWNFWTDHKHILNPGKVCGHRIVRVAPQRIEIFGDGEGMPSNVIHTDPTEIQIFHYGFIRNVEQLSKKGKEIQIGYWGEYDPIWDEVDKSGKQPLMDLYPIETLIPFNRSHPKVAQKWLSEHGFH